MTAHRPFARAGSELEGVAQVIGEQNLTRLCEVLGGTMVYVPRAIIGSHPIAIAIGKKAADMLAEHYYGTRINLPKAHHRRQRAIEMAKSGEMTVAEAARACDYTERHLYRLIKPEDDGQLSLF